MFEKILENSEGRRKKQAIETIGKTLVRVENERREY